MRVADVVQSLNRRIHFPLTWIAVLMFGGLFGLFETWALAARGYHGPLAWVCGWVSPVLGSVGYGLLSPIPWQWSGDPRPSAGYVRGALQSFLCSLAYFVFLHYLDQFLFLSLVRPDRLATFGRLTLFPYVFQAPFLMLVGLFIVLGERNEWEKMRAEARLQEAQWILLRAQLSPHVLFNTLNALAELARRDPEATERALLDLSDLYERMLRHGELLLAPLQEERVVVERYLSLQVLRLGPRLQVRWAWEATVDQVLAPPLLLQPLVENALKHGIAAQAGHGEVLIRAERGSGCLRLEVHNTGAPPKTPGGRGTGLRNLKERLSLAYGGKARFYLERRGEWTVAVLELPEVPWT